MLNPNAVIVVTSNTPSAGTTFSQNPNGFTLPIGNINVVTLGPPTVLMSFSSRIQA